MCVRGVGGLWILMSLFVGTAWEDVTLAEMGAWHTQAHFFRVRRPDTQFFDRPEVERPTHLSLHGRNAAVPHRLSYSQTVVHIVVGRLSTLEECSWSSSFGEGTFVPYPIFCPQCYPWVYPPGVYWGYCYCPWHHYYVVPLVVYYDPAAPVLRDLLGMNARGRPRPPMGRPTEVFAREPARAPQPQNGEPHDNPPRPDNPAQGGAMAPRPSLRTSNERQRQLAARFIEIGDRLFREGRYRQAFFQYREAEKAAPDFAESYFRQGFALIATGQYGLAFQAFKKGLSIDPQWPKRPVELSRLYVGRELDQHNHRAALAAQADANPMNEELHFLLGIHLFSAGRKQDAQEFFRKVQASPIAGGLVQLFADGSP